jgi:RecA-family ATPase
LAGEDADLAAPANRNIIAATPLWRQLVKLIEEWQPTLIVLDTLADLFAGEENSRPQTRHFVGMLKGVAIKRNATVILLAHPSLSGIASGSGTSGSTGWHNSVRSRLYLTRMVSDGVEPDPNLRLLTNKKQNYGPSGTEFRIRWEDGAFVREGSATETAGAFGALNAMLEAEAVFLNLLGQYTTQGRNVGASPSSSYAPVQFAREPQAKGIKAKAFTAAMNSLFQKNRIRVEQFGPPSKPRNRIALVEPTVEEAAE